MSQENVEVVRRHVEAWNRCDLMTLSALWRSDGEIDWSRARGPLKGVYRGQRERAHGMSEVLEHGLLREGALGTEVPDLERLLLREAR